MFIYEKERSNVDNYIYLQRDDNLNFPLHVHTTYELVCVTEGCMSLSIDGINYKLSPHDCALIFPNQVHSYETPKTSKSSLCIFSSDLIEVYAQNTNTYEPTVPYFKLDQPVDHFFNSLESANCIYEKKSKLYHMISLFHDQRIYQEKKKITKDFIGITLQYIEHNFTENISLHDLSKQLGYDYHYTSSLFNLMFQRSFIELVNRYRLQRASYLLKTTTLKLSDIGFQSGFNSHRAFNRNFMKYYATTPSNYRQSFKRKTHISNTI